MPNRKATIKQKNLAFWESLCDEEPKRYLNAGEQIEVTGSATLFGGIHGDKEYYKVKHHVYGLGYMLKKGFESSD